MMDLLTAVVLPRGDDRAGPLAVLEMTAVCRGTVLHHPRTCTCCVSMIVPGVNDSPSHRTLPT